jgi:stage III sporulation protein AD
MMLLYFFTAAPLKEILSVLSDLSARAGISAGSLSVVFRGLGISLLTRFASGVCVDCGLRSLGETVDYCGQIALALLALPLVSDLVQTVSEVS